MYIHVYQNSFYIYGKAMELSPAKQIENKDLSSALPAGRPTESDSCSFDTQTHLATLFIPNYKTQVCDTGSYVLCCIAHKYYTLIQIHQRM